MLNILSRQQQNASLGLRYIVPLEWWQTILALNSKILDPSQLNIANQLNLQSYIETIQSTEREALIKLVGQKVNFLQIDNLVLNPRLKTATKWKTVSVKFLEVLKNKLGVTLTLPLMYLKDISKQQNEPIWIEQTKKFKIIKLLLCSYTQNHLFYGYVDEKVQTKKLIQQIISLLEYFSTENTRVTFLQSCEFRNYKFQECFEEFRGKDQLIMVHGLERYDQKVYEECQMKQENVEFLSSAFDSPRMTRVQRNGEELTMADEDSLTMSEHTMSTGAETPFTFGFQEQDWDLFRPYHKYVLFGEKLQEEIEHMKEYARQAIYTDIIQVPLYKQELMINELDKLAEDIEENIEKKKIYQKEIVKDAKEYFKDLKETHHSLYFKDKEICSKEAKQLYSNKTIQSQPKIKESFRPVVYFSLSNENN